MQVLGQYTASHVDNGRTDHMVSIQLADEAHPIVDVVVDPIVSILTNVPDDPRFGAIPPHEANSIIVQYHILFNRQLTRKI